MHPSALQRKPDSLGAPNQITNLLRNDPMNTKPTAFCVIQELAGPGRDQPWVIRRRELSERALEHRKVPWRCPIGRARSLWHD